MIFYSELNGEIVGTVALLKRGPKTFELAKMAVSEKFQGKKIGRKLIEALIDRAAAKGATSIYLETNDSLTPAVNLYRSVGFLPDPTRDHGVYQRVNLVMQLLLKH